MEIELDEAPVNGRYTIKNKQETLVCNNELLLQFNIYSIAISLTHT